MQVTLSIITSPLLITSCRVCGWNAKMIFVHSKHILSLEHFRGGIEESYFLTKSIEKSFQC